MPKKTFERLDQGKKHRIERAAIKVINDRGYDRTTIRDVVRAANIPRGSFYQYFDGMSDLFSHLLTVVSQRKMAYMKDVWDKLQSMSFIRIYPELIRSGLDFAYSDKEAYLFGYHLFHTQSEDLVKLRKTVEKKGIAMMQGLLEIDRNKGILKEDVNTRLLAGMLYDFNARQLTHMVYDHEDKDTMMNLANEFLTIIYHGIMKEEV